MPRPERNAVFVTRIHRGGEDGTFGRVFERDWIRSSFKPPRSVAIKVNLCDYRLAESGATTDPAVLGALLRELDRRYSPVRIAVVENDATSVQADTAFRLLGIEKVAREHGADVINVARSEWIVRKVEGARVLSEVEVPAVVAEADLFINFAKLKTNSFTKMTGCLKNMFGLVRSKRKTAYHGRLADVLIDLTRAMEPDLCLVDGLIGMEGVGAPAFGRPRPTGLLIAGLDPVAVDACCSRVMGFWPLFVAHVRQAHQAGVGSIRYRLDTDITAFDYAEYRFGFSRVHFILRSLIRGRVGLGV